LYKCEVCGKRADEHHVIYRSQGGMNFPLNIRYLCHEHHRGKNGPHKNKSIDLQYKLQLQDSLRSLLKKQYYREQELTDMLQVKSGSVKKLLKGLKLHKEGYDSSEIIFRLMGKREYDEYMLEEFCEFIANF